MKIGLFAHKAPGQVMITSILILGFLTLTAVTIGITAIARETQSTLAIENKALASAAATACAEQAIDRLGRDETYSGNEVLAVADMECTIRPILFNANIWTIETYSEVNKQIARYRILLSGRAPVLINSWEEVATF
ncbi:MAG: hypothetical protein P1P90_04795 [Patescibacteria group bacterium]|nr:hypothetical protein [Patescibacteria group bacterium]